jgi:hypothetical protein
MVQLCLHPLHCTALEWGIMKIKIKLEIMKKKEEKNQRPGK